jgi:putative spermidine/putrescine transport system permease protein
MKQHDKERLKYGLLLSPLAIIAFLVLIVPIISIVLGSLKEDGSSTYSLYNYMYILGSKFYKQSFANSIKISLISSILGIVISFQLAYSISKLNNRIKDVVLLYSNMMSNFSGLPLAFALIVILGTNGAITLILQKIGISEFNIYTQAGLILAYTYFQIPLGTLLLYPALDALNESWKEACSLLGGTKKDFWLRIGLPILKSSIIGTTIILFTNAIGAYATVFGIMTSNYNVIPIRIGALISGDVILKPNMASALAIMLIIIISVVFFVNEKFIQRRKY